MLQAKCLPLLLFVATLLMASCHIAEGAKDGYKNDGTGELESFNITCNSTRPISHFAYGITANIAAVLLYGSNFVPVKRVETGDGMFFQWVTCAAIWVISMTGDLVLQSPKFCPFAMLGGVLWATGNVAVVPFVKAIGLGLGILISGSSNLLMGWASSRFGWFGIAAQNVSRPILNYCGAGLCLLSGLIFFFVKADVTLLHRSETIPLLIDRRTNSGNYGPNSSESWIDAIGPKSKRFIGFLLAVVAGLMYASSVIPVLYIKSHSVHHDSMFYEASVYDLDYVHAHCCGIFIASTVYFAIYCAAMNTKPKLYSSAVLPGLLSGLMWALGTYCWFLANNYLNSVITFPIVTAPLEGNTVRCAVLSPTHELVPEKFTPSEQHERLDTFACGPSGYGLVAALWGCLVFKEIKGLANCLIFSLASCVVLTGSVLTATSNL